MYMPKLYIYVYIYIIYPAFINPSLQYGNPLSRIVGTSGKRLIVRLMSSWLLKSCRPTAVLFLLFSWGWGGSLADRRTILPPFFVLFWRVYFS